MSMTDPIADMLTRVRNANSVGKADGFHAVEQEARRDRPHHAGRGLYRRASKSSMANPAQRLEITLKYGPKKAKTIRGIKPHFQAWSAHLRWQERPPARSRRPRYRNHLD